MGYKKLFTSILCLAFAVTADGYTDMAVMEGTPNRVREATGKTLGEQGVKEGVVF